MKLLNYTNRDILFVHPDDMRSSNGRYFAKSDRKFRVNQLIEKQPKPLQATIETQNMGKAGSIPIINETVRGADPIPTTDPDTLIIVSKQYADACRKLCRPTHNLRVTVGAVFVEDKNTPVACVGLATVDGCCSPYVY